MTDLLRSLDGTQRAMLTIFLAVAIKSHLLVRWEQYKARQAALPISMACRGGVYVANGPVQKIQRAWQAFLKVWLAYMAIVIAAVCYCKANGISF